MTGLAEEEIERSALFRWLRMGGGLLLLAAVIVVIVMMLKGLGGGAKGPQRQVTKISVLPDTPPPPPPPPKEEKRPDPPKAEQKEMKAEPPKEPTPQAPSETLKMEGAAGDGPSPFSAGTVTRENAFGSGGRLAFSFYTNNLQRYLQEELAKHKRLRRVDYRVRVRLWLGSDGAIQRVEIAGSSGMPEVDESIRAGLSELAHVRERPPENMPQPLHLRISNRGAG